MYKLSLITTALICLSPLSSVATEVAGKTMIAKGKVAAEDQNEARKLRRRSPIYNVDVVTTSSDSKAQFRMSDGSMVALQENSKLIVKEYKYQPEQEDNSMVLELVEGGLRSVTGAIKNNNGKYKLNTPVGSIGIRGTHFEVEVIDGDMFLAVWDGAIDLTLPTGPGAQDTVSFGEDEDFSFGIVTEEGEVTQLLEPPSNFSDGHSSSSTDESAEQESEEDNSEQQNSSSDDQQSTDDDSTTQQTEQQESDTEIAQNTDTTDIETSTPEEQNSELDVTLDESKDLQDVNEEVIAAQLPALPEFIANRTGSFTYQNVVESSLSSSAGGASGLNLSMTVDFDNAYVPSGEMSFTDSEGLWYATFNGAISASAIELGINFASHANNHASGNMNAYFTNQGNNISGQFNLSDEKGASASGSFIIE